MEYKQRYYEARSDFGNMSKPDDLCSRAIFEIFNHPSRAFAFIHVIFGISLLVFTFYAIS